VAKSYQKNFNPFNGYNLMKYVGVAHFTNWQTSSESKVQA